MAFIESVPIEQVPAAQIAGGQSHVPMVKLSHISRAIDLAGQAYSRADEAPDDLATLRTSVNELADAVRLLGGELYNLTAGVQGGKIAVEPIFAD